MDEIIQNYFSSYTGSLICKLYVTQFKQEFINESLQMKRIIVDE